MKSHSQVFISACAIALASFAMVSTPQACRAQTNQPGVKLRPLFTGTLPLNSPRGEVLIPVKLYGVSLWGPRPIRNLEPLAAGMAVIHFQTGRTETSLGGAINRNQVGDFLLLQRGSPASFRVVSEAATFEAFLLGGPLAGATVTNQPAERARPQREPYRQIPGGPLKREAMVSRRVGDFSVEVQDLLIGPLQKTGTFSLPGAALLQVKCGKGVFTSGGNRQAIKGGSIVSVKDGQLLELQNNEKDLGLAVQATIVRSQ